MGSREGVLVVAGVVSAAYLGRRLRSTWFGSFPLFGARGPDRFLLIRNFGGRQRVDATDKEYRCGKTI